MQPEDREHHRKYGEYLVAVEEMLERTDTEWGPWTIVEATDRRWARVKIFQALIQRTEEALRDRGYELPAPEPPTEDEDLTETPPDEEVEFSSSALDEGLSAEAEVQAGEE